MTSGERDEEDLLGRLSAAAAAADGPPAGLHEAAKAAFGLRRLDAELAELVADSLEGPAVVRGGETLRLLSFVVGAVTVDVEVTRRGGRCRLMGQLAGGNPPLFVDTPEESVPVETDEIGRFTADDIPPGPLRLRWRSAAGEPVVTSWVTV